jgi:hypothetical protein
MLRPFSVVVIASGLIGLGAAVSGAETRSAAGITVYANGFSVVMEAAQGGAVQRPRPFRQWRLPDRRGPSQEPASARGYADGYRHGLDDGRDRDRYDPVGHGNYKAGDPGYYREYGPRESYRNNYRAGFRQGYENGYRDGSRGRR